MEEVATPRASTTQLLGGRNRFVLGSWGHIAGIVNPPSPKAKHWVNEDNLPADPAGVERRAAAGSHLVGGLVDMDRRPGRSHGRGCSQDRRKEHPAIEPAPGSYGRAVSEQLG